MRKSREANVFDLFRQPLPPYTQGLIRATPDGAGGGRKTTRLTEIPGMVPALTAMPPGCAFAPRCGFATKACTVAPPPLTMRGSCHQVACIHALAAAAPKAEFA